MKRQLRRVIHIEARLVSELGAAVGDLLASDAIARPWYGGEAANGDVALAAGTDSVGAFGDALEGRFDGGQTTRFPIQCPNRQFLIVGVLGLVGGIRRSFHNDPIPASKRLLKPGLSCFEDPLERSEI